MRISFICEMPISLPFSHIKNRSFVKESNANIKLSSPGDLIPGIQDRLVTVAGSLAEQVKAVALIVKKISEDANYLQYASAPSMNIGK
jgi:RNA-binding protein Nova